MIIDATNSIVGRLGTVVAKEVLRGREVKIVNSEKAIVIGDPKLILKRSLEKRKLGTGVQKGPHYPSKPDMMLKRSIRGMLPWKRTSGREAYKRIKCFIGVPELLKEEKTVSFANKKKPLKFITLGRLSSLIRQK
ncbi:MAG: 50S ribosomal protein L13 [archaeon]